MCARGYHELASFCFLFLWNLSFRCSVMLKMDCGKWTMGDGERFLAEVTHEDLLGRVSSL